jgi:phage baseplate assembly protein W
MLRSELLSFPLLDGIVADGRLAWQQGNESVREVMLNILLTRPGERLMRPEFGAGILDYIHQPNNETTRTLIVDVARRAITRWEPRVTLEEVSLRPDPIRLSQVNLSIRYRLLHDGSSGSLDLSVTLGA